MKHLIVIEIDEPDTNGCKLYERNASAWSTQELTGLIAKVISYGGRANDFMIVAPVDGHARLQDLLCRVSFGAERATPGEFLCEELRKAFPRDDDMPF